MVKLAIIGAQSPQAGEMIRILVHHSEVDLVTLYAPSLKGRNVASVHHGLIGEQSLIFSDRLDLSDVDLLIVADDISQDEYVTNQFNESEDLKVISLKKDWFTKHNIENKEVGLSEINRKALVRGAKNAYLLSPAIVPVLISLIPLSNFLLLNSDIDIDIILPPDLINSINVEEEVKEITNLLKAKQNSFKNKINLRLSPSQDPSRAVLTDIRLQNNLSIDELERIFEDIYDDHNFTFLSHEITPAEVEGTQKVIMKLEKPESDLLNIQLVNDSRLRGGAGDAVHVLNLFFGLHEKTGLYLKASRFS